MVWIYIYTAELSEMNYLVGEAVELEMSLENIEILNKEIRKRLEAFKKYSKNKNQTQNNKKINRIEDTWNEYFEEYKNGSESGKGKTQFHSDGDVTDGQHEVTQGKSLLQSRRSAIKIKNVLPKILVSGGFWNSDKTIYTIDLRNGKRIEINVALDTISIPGSESTIKGFTSTYENMIEIGILNHLNNNHFTAYHEAWHMLENMFLSETDMETLKKELGIDRTLSERDQSELIANEFAKYMVDAKSFSGKVSNLFKRLWMYIKYMFGKSHGKEAVESVFDKIKNKDISLYEESAVNARMESRRAVERMGDVFRMRPDLDLETDDVKEVSVRVRGRDTIDPDRTEIENYLNSLIGESMKVSYGDDVLQLDEKGKTHLLGKTLKDFNKAILLLNLEDVVEGSRFIIDLPNRKPQRRLDVDGYKKHLVVENIDGVKHLVLIASELYNKNNPHNISGKEGLFIYDVSYEDISNRTNETGETNWAEIENAFANLLRDHHDIPQRIASAIDLVTPQVHKNRLREICQELFLNFLKNNYPNEKSLISLLQNDLENTLLRINNSEARTTYRNHLADVKTELEALENDRAFRYRAYLNRLEKQKKKIKSIDKSELSHIEQAKAKATRITNDFESRIKPLDDKIKELQSIVDDKQSHIDELYASNKLISLGKDDKHAKGRLLKTQYDGSSKLTETIKSNHPTSEYRGNKKDINKTIKKTLKEFSDFRKQYDSFLTDLQRKNVDKAEKRIIEVFGESLEEMQEHLYDNAFDSIDNLEHKTAQEKQTRRLISASRMTLDQAVNNMITIATTLTAADVINDATPDARDSTILHYAEAEQMAQDVDNEQLEAFKKLTQNGYDWAVLGVDARNSSVNSFKQVTELMNNRVADTDTEIQELFNKGVEALVSFKNALSSGARLMAYSKNPASGLEIQQQADNVDTVLLQAEDIKNSIENMGDNINELIDDINNLINSIEKVNEHVNDAKPIKFDWYQQLKSMKIMSLLWNAGVMGRNIAQTFGNVMLFDNLSNFISTAWERGSVSDMRAVGEGGVKRGWANVKGEDAGSEHVGSKFGFEQNFDFSDTKELGKLIHKVSSWMNIALTRSDAFNYGIASKTILERIALTMSENKNFVKALYGDDVSSSDAYKKILAEPHSLIKNYVEKLALDQTYTQLYFQIV